MYCYYFSFGFAPSHLRHHYFLAAPQVQPPRTVVVVISYHHHSLSTKGRNEARLSNKTIENTVLSIMTGSEILNIVVTVGFSQLVIDLLSSYIVFRGEDYQRLIKNMERSKSKLDRAEADLKRSDKHQKKVERAQAEYSTACADVARKHMLPSLASSVYFFLLLKILGTEYQGRVMGVLPFVPFNIVKGVTGRGLDWTDVPLEALAGTKLVPNQAFSFLCVYILAGLSVKYYVNKLVATKPPPGADRGVMSVIDSPAGHHIARSFGLNPDDLKQL